MTTVDAAVDIAVPDLLASHLPASPVGLVQLAGFFDRQGHQQLARYLRSCADHIAMSAAPVPVAVASLQARKYHVAVDGVVSVSLSGDQDQVHAVRLGDQYLLVRMPQIDQREPE